MTRKLHRLALASAAVAALGASTLTASRRPTPLLSSTPRR
jgi:hypothetical protein